MRYKVTKRQFNILLDNFKLIGDRGLSLKMNGKTAKEVIGERSHIGKSYIVNFSLNGFRSKIKIYSNNNTRARKIAKELLPNAKILNAYEIK